MFNPYKKYLIILLVLISPISNVLSMKSSSSSSSSSNKNIATFLGAAVLASGAMYLILKKKKVSRETRLTPDQATFEMWEGIDSNSSGLSRVDLSKVRKALSAGADRLDWVATGRKLGQKALPIHRAAEQSLDLVKLLLEKSTDEQLNAQDSDGRTPLFWAIPCQPEVVAFLLEQGADVTIIDHDNADIFAFAKSLHVKLDISQRLSLDRIARELSSLRLSRLKDSIKIIKKFQLERVAALKKITELTVFPPGLLPIITGYLGEQNFPEVHNSATETQEI